MKKLSKLILFGLLTCLVLVGCQKNDSKSSAENNDGSFVGDYIISAADAKEKIGKDNVLFIDARGDAKKTLDGAIVLGWPELAKMDVENDTVGWGTIPEADDVANRLSEKGISKDKEIILFSTANKGWGDDGRILWELKSLGYDNLKMVDGGVDALEKAGVTFDSDPATLEKAEVQIDKVDRTHVINTDELVRDYDKYVIVDSREAKEYDGAVLYGEKQGGHLPNAINVPFTTLFKENGELKSNEDLKAMFEEKGITSDKSVVTYCTGGIRSGYMQVILEMLGYNDSKNYEGSYYTWSATQEVEK